MKKLLLGLIVASMANAVQARNININLSMPNQKTYLVQENSGICVEMTAEPSGNEINMEFEIYDQTVQGKKLVSQPCITTEPGQAAKLCIENICEDGTSEKLEVNVAVQEADEAEMKVEVTE